MKKISYLCVVFWASFFWMQGVFAGCIEDCQTLEWDKYTQCTNACDAQTTTSAWTNSIGIDMNTECMLYGGCKMDVSKMLWLKTQSTTDNDRTSVLMFVQDAVLSATFFIGTIVTLAFIRSGVLFIVSGRNGDSSKRKTAQQGMIHAAIGLLLVSASYAIVKLIQFLASGG